MKKIKSIDILNFKVFRHREFFELDGKNLLVYGTNGSGKSSLFWALYTFLQSSNKEENEVKKYFDPEDERNLRNIFSQPTDPSFIKVTFLDDNKKETTNTIDVTIKNNPDYNKIIDEDVITGFLKKETINTKEKFIKSYILNTIGDADILIADAASDFINYRLLLNFYIASHRYKTDLIVVFERDIFPFFNNSDGKSFSKIFYDLMENPPRVLREKKLAEEKKANPGFERLTDATIRNIIEEYEVKRTKFNEELKTLFNELNYEGNLFLKKHFTNNEDKYRFEIAYLSENNSDGEESYLKLLDLRIKEDGLAAEPYITLNVWQKDSGGVDKDIWRPHSFLNEAKLTQLALSIRLAALKIKLQKSPSIIKTLILDDLLISLDMSNRLIVLEIILEEFKDYQLIILTHDKSFFDLVNLKTIKDKKDWIKLEFYDTEDEGNPIIKINEDYLLRAENYKAKNEFDLAAIMLRKKAEYILKIFLDPELKQLSAFETKDTLSDFFTKAKNHPFNKPYKKFIEFIQSQKIEVEDLEEYNINHTAIKNTVKGSKITDMVEFLHSLLAHSKTQFQWLKDSEELRINLTKLVGDMEDLSSRVLNPHSHATTSAVYKREIEEAILIIKDANSKLGLN